MKKNKENDLILLAAIWALWSLLVIGYQAVVDWRLELKRPDSVLMWTANETAKNSQDDKAYLVEPFMNHQVSWDSEFYLSMATVGYADPLVRSVTDPQNKGESLSMSYAFFPLYGWVMRAARVPLLALGLSPIAASTLAGVLISLLGTLGAMIALYDLAKPLLEREGSLRAVYYLLIFPSAFFLAQVYTEGLFLGLSFGCMALARRDQWLPAGLLAAAATLTRPLGGLVVIPLAYRWWQASPWKDETRDQPVWEVAVKSVGVALPVIAFLAWRASELGRNFFILEDQFFGRHFLAIGATISAWGGALESVLKGNSQAAVYYALEAGSLLLGLVTCGLFYRREKDLALYSLAVILLSLFSGAAQGMARYVLAAPVIFLCLGQWGKNRVFDRAWTFASVLLFGLSAMLFSFDFWVG